MSISDRGRVFSREQFSTDKIEAHLLDTPSSGVGGLIFGNWILKDEMVQDGASDMALEAEILHKVPRIATRSPEECKNTTAWLSGCLTRWFSLVFIK